MVTKAPAKRHPASVQKPPRAPKATTPDVDAGVGAEPAPAPTNGTKPTPPLSSIGKGIARYLNEVRDLGIGRIGRPSVPRKPETLRKSIALHEKRLAEAKSPLVELVERSTLLDLRAMLAEMGTPTARSEAHTFFVAYAGAWAVAKGVSYPAFREMGVPAAVLREAGITP